MQFFKQFSRTIPATIFLVSVLVYGIIAARAQTTEPDFLFTWKASSYAPNDFLGKILPTDRSSITVSFELIERGRIVSLAKSDIYWYVNEDFFKGGAGLQEITFRANGVGKQGVRIKINDYQGQTLVKSLEIPSVKPEVVIPIPFPGGKPSGLKIQLQAQPFFFNVSNPDDLDFSWMVNDQTPNPSGNPMLLDIVFKQTPPAGTTLNVSLNTRNPRNIFEIASMKKTLQFGN